MRRVVVTGIGIVSSIGTSRQAVTAALRHGSSGIATVKNMRNSASGRGSTAV